MRIGDRRRRMLAVVAATTVIFAAFVGKVVWMQTAGADALLAAGRAQRVTEKVLVAKRGTIFARDGGELALSVPSTTVYADPRLVTDPVGTAASLASVLALSPEKQQALVEAFTSKDRAFIYVARQIDDQLADAVMSMNLAGIDTIAEEKRTMPSGEVGRSVLGRTDIDGVGIAGLERQFEDLLKGVDGERIRERDVKGRSIPGSGTTTIDPIPGTDLVLTIDRSLQFQVEQALLTRVEELKAAGGTVVVLDSASGDILSMANVSRDSTGVAGVSSANLALVEAFEPGSVAKVFSLSSVIDTGTATPESTIDVPGSMVFNKGTQWEDEIFDAKPHGLQQMSLRDIIVDSSNIGTLLFTEKVGTDRFAEYLKLFGFGRKTPLDFPDESAGRIKPAREWQGIEPATISYGYGYTTTALQLAAAVNAVANGGVYVAPRLLAATIDPMGEISLEPASASHRVIREESARTMTSMMTDVVCRGTGRDARLAGMSVAGKTGTAYKAQDGNYGVEGEHQYRASFVGYFPAQAPRVTILVTIDEPDPTSADRFGGKAAAPLFARLAAAAVNELAITPVPGDQGCAGG